MVTYLKPVESAVGRSLQMEMGKSDVQHFTRHRVNTPRAAHL